ncbi:MAG: tetratricopeptide repeat protein, partial [Candidatus Aminicenantes bacterium]|nr:tetratricopeptide repeat protein [Candidatus Aminicenantes bacterium]
MKGLRAITAGDYEQAIAIFKAAAQGGQEKDRFINFYFLGNALYQNKQVPEAIAAFEESLKHRGKASGYDILFLPTCFGSLGQAYLENKKYQEAAASFLNAATAFSLMTSTEDPAMYKRSAGSNYGLMGNAHLLNKSYQEAVSAYEKAMELDPMNGLHYSGLALVHVELKQYDDALAAAKRGVELAANSQASYANLGDVHAARKEYDQAIDAYRKAVEVAPLQLADYKTKYGKYLPQRALDLALEETNIASAGFYVKSSRMSVAKGDYASAVEAIDKAAALAPNNSGIYSYQLGTIHAQTGKFDEAIASLDKAIGLVAPVRIGAYIVIEKDQPILREPIEGPAKEAGLKAGDRLIMIGGQSTKGWDINKTSQNLRGEENTQVVLKIQRQGEAKPFERTITRKLI